MLFFPLLALKDLLHPAGQPEHDPVLTVHRHAVHQPGPQALVELGDELRQVLHALNEAFDLLVQPTTPSSERAGGGDVQLAMVVSIIPFILLFPFYYR